MNFLQNKIRSVILSQASHYFKDIDSNNLSEAASLGDITLKDLELKENVIDLGDQPFKVVSGKFQVVDLKIPFNRLFSEPCIIIVEGVDLKVELKSVDQIKINKDEDFKKLKNSFIIFVQSQFKKEFGQTGGGGFADFWMVKSAVERIFDNLQISIKRVNITIVDKSSNNTQIKVSLGELEAKTTDSSYMKAIYVKRGDMKGKRIVVHKRIIFSNFMVSVGDYMQSTNGNYLSNSSLRESNTHLAQLNQKQDVLFKFSFTAKVQITPPLPDKPLLIRKRSENPVPQYLVNCNISTYNLSISQTQLQSILRLLENMQLYNNKVSLLKDSGSLKPQFKIGEILDSIDHEIGHGRGAYRVLNQRAKKFQNSSNQCGLSLESFENLKNKKTVVVNRWWKYAILSILKKVRTLKKEKKKEKLLGIVDGGGFEKMFEFRLPMVMKDVYEKEMDRIVENIVENKLDDENLKDLKTEEENGEEGSPERVLTTQTEYGEEEQRILTPKEKLQQLGNNIIDLRSIIFTLGEGERKSMAKKSAIKISDKHKERNKNTWGAWAKSYLPFIFKKTEQEKNREEIESMIKDQIGKKGDKKWNKHFLELNMNVNQALISFVGGTDDQKIIFQNKMNGMKLGVDSYGDTLTAKVRFKSFVFSFIKQFMNYNTGQSETVSFDILKSTVPENGNFLMMDYASVGTEKQSDTVIDVSTEHMDFFFVKNVFRDLQGFFTVKADQEMRDQAWSEISRLSQKSKTKMAQSISRKKVTTTINYKGKSPRIVMPLTDSLQTLDSDTNLFILYLGDLNFKNTIRPNILTTSNTKYDCELLNFKLEFWEDYSDAVHALNYNTDKMFKVREVGGNCTKPIPSFVVLDFSAFLEYQVQGANSSISFISDRMDMRINSHLYHNLMEVPKLLNFKEEEKQGMMEERKNNILKKSVLAKKVAMKRNPEEKYKFQHSVLSNRALYFYEKKDDLNYSMKYFLPYSNLDYFEEKKTKASILKITKSGEQGILLAFKNKSKAQNFAEKLIKHCPSLETQSQLKKQKLEDDLDQKPKPSKMEFEFIIKETNLGLYDDLYKKFFVLQIENLDTKIQTGEEKKVKASFCSLNCENCNDAFKSKDLNTIVFIGATQMPKTKRAHQKVEESLDDSQSSLTVSFSNLSDSSFISRSSTGTEYQPKVRFSDNHLPTIEETNENQFGRVAGGNSEFEFSQNLNFKKKDKNLTSQQRFPDMSASQISIENDFRNLRLQQESQSRNSLGMQDVFNQEFNYSKFSKPSVLQLMNSAKTSEKGFLLYLNQTNKCQDINLKAVNMTVFWDLDYIRKLLSITGDFKPDKTPLTPEEKKKQQDAYYKQPEKKAIPEKEEITQKISVNFGRFCVVCRSKNRNLFDMVMVKLKVQMQMLTCRRLVNIFMKRFAIRDLTGYPFTKQPHELQDYSVQKRQTLISFSEGLNKDGSSKKKDPSKSKLDSNGIAVITEVIHPAYRGEDRLAVKAEVFLNNGEIHLFLQPIFRLLDFIFQSLMGHFVPDDTLTAPLYEIKRRLAEPGKNLYNVFIRNTNVHLRPNFITSKYPLFNIKEAIIVNSVDVDPSRHKSGSQKLMTSETLSIDIKKSSIKSFDRKSYMMKQEQMRIVFKKFQGFGYWQRVLGEKRMFEEIDVNNKIDVFMKNMEFNMRKDDFYSLMTYVFCNLSFDDEMDQLLYILPPKMVGPWGGMDVNVLIQGMNIGFFDDHLLKFMDIKFDYFYVLMKRDNWKNQKIDIFGSGMDSNAYSYNLNSDGATKKSEFAFVKTIEKIQDVVGHKVQTVNKIKMAKYDFASGKDLMEDWEIQELVRKVGSHFLNFAVNGEEKDYRNIGDLKDFEIFAKEAAKNSQNGQKSKKSRRLKNPGAPTLCMSVNMSNKGHKDIYMDLRNIGISLVSPVIFGAKALTGMTYEMAQNSLIRPSLRKYFGNMRTFITIDNAFIYFLPPIGMDYTLALHVPEISVVYSKEWGNRDEMLNDIKIYYDKREFEDEKVKSLTSMGEKLPVYHMAVELLDTSMFLVENDDIKKWCQELIEKGDHTMVSNDIDARMVMSPIKQIGYHLQTDTLIDRFKEVYFSRGIAKIDEVILMMTSYDLHYLSEWSGHMNRKYWNNLKVEGKYHQYVQDLIKSRLPADWLQHIEKTYKKKLDIDFEGMKVVLLDDVYDTNIEFLKMYLHPIKTTQVDGYKVKGFTDIYTKVEAEYFNYNCKQWEPILENFNLIIKKFNDEDSGSVTEIHLNDPNTSVNITTELLCLVQGLQAERNLRNNYYVLRKTAKAIESNINQRFIEHKARQLEIDQFQKEHGDKFGSKIETSPKHETEKRMTLKALRKALISQNEGYDMITNVYNPKLKFSTNPQFLNMVGEEPMNKSSVSKRIMNNSLVQGDTMGQSQIGQLLFNQSMVSMDRTQNFLQNLSEKEKLDLMNRSVFDLKQGMQLSKSKINDKNIIERGVLDLSKNPLHFKFAHNKKNILGPENTYENKLNKKHSNLMVSKLGHLFRNVLNSQVAGNSPQNLEQSQILRGLNMSGISLPENHPMKKSSENSSLYESQMITSKFYGQNPLQQSFWTPESQLKLPDKAQLQKMIKQSKSEYLDEVNLKEMPFYVQNFTGYPLIFHLKYNEFSANFYLPNLKTVGLPYPYNVSQELLEGKGDVLQEFNYWAFLALPENQDFLKCIYRGSEIIGKYDDEMIKVPKGFALDDKNSLPIQNMANFLKNKNGTIPSREDLDLDKFEDMNYYDSHKDEKGNWRNWKRGDITQQKQLKLRSSGNERKIENFQGVDKTDKFDEILMTSRPNIMRQLVELSSKVIVRNEIKPTIKVHFKNFRKNQNFIKLKENQMVPLPFDKVEDQVKIEIENKSGRVLSGKWFCPQKIADSLGEEVLNYKVGEAFAFNMFLESVERKSKGSNGLDVKKLVMVPPVIIKNKILTNLNFYIVKTNFDKVYGEKHKIRFDDDDYEIYEILDEQLRIRLGINGLKSETIEIDVSKQSEIYEKSVWIYKNQRKAININLLGRFERGSYVLDVFMKAMLVDELFMELKYSQNIGTSEEIIHPINKKLKEDTPFGLKNQMNHSFSRSLVSQSQQSSHSFREESEDSEGGLSKIFFLQEDEPLYLADPKYIYEQASIATDKIGNKDYRVFKFNNKLNSVEYYDIVACTYNHTFASSSKNISTRVIHLKPKYIMQNSSEYVFTVVQANQNKIAREIVLNTSERAPLFSNDKQTESPVVKFRVKDHDWSDALNLKQPMLIFIALKKKIANLSNKYASKNKYEAMKEKHTGFEIEEFTNFNIQMTFSNDSYLLLLRQDIELSPIKVKNQLRNTVLLVSQDPEKLKNKKAELVVNYGEERFFSWAKPFTLEKKIYAVAYNINKKEFSEVFLIRSNEPSSNYSVMFNPIFEDMEYKIGKESSKDGLTTEVFKMVGKITNLEGSKQKQKRKTKEYFQNKNLSSKIKKIYHFSKVSGVANKIVLCEMINNDMLKAKVQSRMVLKCPNMGFSVIGGKLQKRKELMFIKLKNFDYSSETTADEYIQQIAITYINIDNNYDHFACYPVMMAPKFPLKYIEQNGLRHLDVYIRSAINKSDVDVMPTSLKIEEKLLSNLLQIQGQMNDDMKILKDFIEEKYKKLRTQDKNKVSYDKQLKDVVKDNWYLREIDSKNQESYVNNFLISDLKFAVSFQQDMDDTDNEYAQWMNNVAFDFVGAILTNIEDAPIELAAVTSRSQSCPMSLATNIAKTQYYEDFKSSLLPILGSLNVIGNPHQLFREISTGVQDYSTKPLDKQSNQPESLTTQIPGNIYKGTSSLVRHTISGAFGSVNKIAKSFADGFSSIHMDKPHNRQRLRMRFRGEKGFVGGMKQGLAMTGLGFKEGITGLYKMPVQGAKKEGVWGGIKGTLKGVVGLVAKPVAGLLDGVSGITRGVGQGVKGVGGDGKEGGSNYRRVRKPRAFYGSEGYMRTYQKTDAQVQAALSEVLDEHNLDGLEGVIETYVGAFSNPKLLAFSKKFLILIDARKNEAELLVTQHSFRGFKSWEELSVERKGSLNALKFQELCQNGKVNDREVYANFENYKPTHTQIQVPKRKSVKFDKVIDQNGNTIHEISQLSSTGGEHEARESLMFIRVDQEADQKLVERGLWRSKSSKELRGVREFRIYAYEKKDMLLVKKFVRENYPNIWY